jgi:hypothetical protein
MDATSRPAWGCLDAREMREAAAGHAEDPAIRAHLASCGQCRQAVHELQGAFGRPMRTLRRVTAGYRRSRSGFWLVLLVLALGALAVVMFLRTRKTPPPEQQATATEPQPVAAPAKRPKPRRARPPRASGSPADAAIVDVIRRNQTGVRMCYERALKRDHGLSLRVDVRVNVSSAGVVDRVSLDGLQDGVPLANCISNVIRTWRFPAASAAYETAFPLRLQQSL